MASRRKAEDMIREGRVTVNGDVVTEMGVTVDPETDRVEADGKPLSLPRRQVFLLNKPKGVVTTMSDERKRRTVAEYFPGAPGLKPVGRLDMNTEGLILVTNDGDLAARLTHPKWGIDKEYHATVQGLPDEKDLARLRKGLWIEGGKTAPAQATLIGTNEKEGTSTISLILHEGKKHQVRLMCEAVGHKVVHLRRVRVGPFLLKGLAPGQMRKLGEKEVQALRRSVGLE